MKTFNFYCDESCHLENDGFPFMLISYVSSAYNQLQLHNDKITELKRKHFYFGEIKWSKVSHSKSHFYSDLIDYFFATDLNFRAVVIEKNKINNSSFEQSYETFYYKMYYQLLHHKINMQYSYNVYIDIKDSLSASRVNKLKNILNMQYGVFRNVQNVLSKECLLLQLSDLLMGAISYHLRGNNKVIAKNKLIDKIKTHANISLGQSTPLNNTKFNLFFIDLK